MSQTSRLTDAELPTLIADDSCEASHTAERPKPTTNSHHKMMLMFALVVIGFAFFLQTRGAEQVTLNGIPLPPTCASRTIFGFNCPGCGLTRSFILLAHGDWHAAWQMHRLGWLLGLATIAQIPYRSAALLRPARPPLGQFFPMAFGYLLIGLLIGNWLIERISTAAP